MVEEYRIPIIATVFLLLVGFAVLENRQIATEGILDDLRKNKIDCEASERELAGLTADVTTRRAQLASDQAAVQELESMAADVPARKAKLEKLQSDQLAAQAELRNTIMAVRTQSIGKDFPQERLANGSTIRNGKFQKVEDDGVTVTSDAGLAKVKAKDLSSDLREKFRFGDPVLAKLTEGSKDKAAAIPVAPITTGGPDSKKIAEIQDQITKLQLQASQYQQTSSSWQTAAQTYRSKNNVKDNRPNVWSIEATKADGEAAKADNLIRLINAQIFELQKKIDALSLIR